MCTGMKLWCHINSVCSVNYKHDKQRLRVYAMKSAENYTFSNWFT